MSIKKRYENWVEQMNKRLIIEQLRENDEKIEILFQQRKALADVCKKAGIYDEIYKRLYRDGESHYEF